MKIHARLRHCNPLLGSVGIIIAFGLVLLACLRGTGQTPAGLSATLVSTNQIQLLVTNAVPGQIYEIQRRLLLNSPYDWQTYLVGTNSQTNFLADMGIDALGFFKALP